MSFKKLLRTTTIVFIILIFVELIYLMIQISKIRKNADLIGDVAEKILKPEGYKHYPPENDNRKWRGPNSQFFYPYFE